VIDKRFKFYLDVVVCFGTLYHLARHPEHFVDATTVAGLLFHLKFSCVDH